jgi:hypothetical protein
LAELESLLNNIGLDAKKFAPLLAPIVDIPAPPEPLSGLPPEEIRRRQLAAIGRVRDRRLAHPAARPRFR